MQMYQTKKLGRQQPARINARYGTHEDQKIICPNNTYTHTGNLYFTYQTVNHPARYFFNLQSNSTSTPDPTAGASDHHNHRARTLLNH